ncbi:hypothetical protein [Ponticoccus litoralis]|uniref:Uncharacterized protein n=1 Tax=Ponticoccus litoralis TaxID=422297 RepID=A0AAW9SDS6_9RHOB
MTPMRPCRSASGSTIWVLERNRVMASRAVFSRSTAVSRSASE